MKHHIIINPKSGNHQQVIRILTNVFKRYDVAWTYTLTEKAGDARQMAESALGTGVDSVAVYGGDGTVREVADALKGTDTPMGLLPGGTANVFSIELDIPRNLRRAVELLCLNPTIREVDVGIANGDIFLVGLGTGSITTMMSNITTEMKERLGYLAYMIEWYKSLQDPPLLTFDLDLDDEHVTVQGVACTISNTGNMGARNVYIPRGTDISDGALDVAVYEGTDLESMLGIAGSAFDLEQFTPPLTKWRAEVVRLEIDVPHAIAYDGDILGETPVEASVLHRGLKVIVPGPDFYPLRGGNLNRVAVSE